jgi:undecaprenyl diphosphate synthase
MPEAGPADAAATDGSDERATGDAAQVGDAVAGAAPVGGELPRDLAVAIIMDGNGRWAQARGLPVNEGHRAGGTALHRVVEAALDLHVSELTVYAFSTENWRRSAAEVRGLLQLFDELLLEEVPGLERQGVRVRFIGREVLLPDHLRARMQWARERTAANTRMELVIAFNYGGRAEIVDAARAVVEAGGLDALDEESLAAAMYLPDLRDPDLIVRSAGEHRTSNFLVWQGAYSELVFVDTMWPDFDEPDLRGAIAEYARRERRFGGRADGDDDAAAAAATTRDEATAAAGERP